MRRPRRPRVLTGKARRAAGMILTGAAAESALPCEMPQIIRVDIGRCRDRAEGRWQARSDFSTHRHSYTSNYSSVRQHLFSMFNIAQPPKKAAFGGKLFSFWKFAKITALVLLYRRVKIYFLAHPARPLGAVRSYLTNGKLW